MMIELLRRGSPFVLGRTVEIKVDPRTAIRLPEGTPCLLADPTLYLCLDVEQGKIVTGAAITMPFDSKVEGAKLGPYIVPLDALLIPEGEETDELGE